jgi:hypothetical protein
VIEVPYETNYQSKTAILLDGDFCELANIERLDDTYYLNVGYFLPMESLIVGNQCHLVLKPVLMCNAVIADVSKLQDINFSLTIETTVGSNTKNYEIAEFKSDVDHVVSFDVQAEILNISAYLTATVKRKSNGSVQSLSSYFNSEYKFANDYAYQKHDFRRGYL